MDLGIAGVAAITIIAYVMGLLVKASPLSNKWIPVICAAFGGVLGIVGRSRQDLCAKLFAGSG